MENNVKAILLIDAMKEYVKEIEVDSLCLEMKMTGNDEKEEIELLNNIQFDAIRKIQYIDASNKKLKVEIFRILERMCNFYKNFREDFMPFWIKHREKCDYDYWELIPYINEIYKFNPSIVRSIMYKLHDYVETPRQYKVYSSEDFLNFVFFLVSVDSYRIEGYFVDQVLKLMPEEESIKFFNKPLKQQEDIQDIWRKCYRKFRNARLDYMKDIINFLNVKGITVSKKCSIINLNIKPLYDLIEQWKL